MLKGRSEISILAIWSVILLSAIVAGLDALPDPATAQTSDCSNGVVVPDPSNNPGLVSDCEALLSVGNALQPKDELNWSAKVPIADWWEVSISGTPPRVTEIDLRHFELAGVIAPELGDVSKLQWLSLGWNRLTGQIPSQLGNLTELEVLSLSNNRLSGELPQSLMGLTMLAYFDFLNNPGLCAPVGDAFQAWLQSIEFVEGSSCALMDSPQDKDILAELHRSTNGMNWSESANWLSDQPMRDWHGVTTDTDGRVTGIYLWDNRLIGEIPSELGTLTNLEVLRLGVNSLSGEIPSELGSLTNLKRLSLFSNSLRGEIPEELGDLTNLKRLDLGSNRLSGKVPSKLGGLPNLEWLLLFINDLSGSIPGELGDLTNLEMLALGGNRLSGEIPSELGDLINLDYMILDDNELNGSIPASLGYLLNLDQLILDYNRLSGEIPASLASLINLQWLSLRGNQLTGCVPERLRQLRYGDIGELSLPDCVAPTTSISLAPKRIPVRINSSVPVTTWFSEPVIGFTVDDVVVANGSAINFSGADGEMVYTFDVTPTGIGEVTVDIFSGVAGDAVGYGNNPAHISLGIPYDDDRDAAISLEEVIAAVEDYFSGVLAIEHAVAIVQLYFSNSN